MKNFLMLFLFLSHIFQSLNAQERMLEENGYFIFSHSDAYNFWQKSNAAILVTDKDSVNELKGLFINNELIAGYKCGYDYQIQFLGDNGEKLQMKIYLNTECDFYTRDDKKIKEFISSFVERINCKPTHYIYNLKINVEMSADYAIDQLREDNLDAFLLSDYHEQFPKLKLTYCEPDIQNRTLDDAERKFKEMVTDIEFGTEPIDSSDIYRTTMYQTKYVDFKTNKISRLYYFPTKTDINSIIKQIDELKINYLFPESCSQYYYLQLLSRDNIKEVSSLLKKYLFINDVTEATDGFVYPECSLYRE